MRRDVDRGSFGMAQFSPLTVYRGDRGRMGKRQLARPQSKEGEIGMLGLFGGKKSLLWVMYYYDRRLRRVLR